MTHKVEATLGQHIQSFWNFISVPAVVIMLMHILAAGPLMGSVDVIDNAVADQLVETIDSDKPELRTVENVDVMHLAVSLGRLDFASLGLTVIGVVLAVFGLMGFLKIDRETRVIAKNEARKEAKTHARSAALEFMKTQEFIDYVDDIVKKETADRMPKEVQKYLDRRSTFDVDGITDSEAEGFIPSDDESEECNRGGQR